MTIYSLDEAFMSGEMTLRGFVDFATDVGVDAVELGYYWRDEQRECDEVRRWVEEAGLEISGYIVSTNFTHEDEAKRRAEIDKVKHGVDGAVALGTDLVRVFAGARKGGPFEADRDRVVEALAECLAYAVPRGVRLAMEDHGGIGGRSEHLLYYAEQLNSDHFGFVVDIANFLANAGEEPLSAVRQVASRAFLAHFKDGVRGEDGTWTPLLAGKGKIPLEESLVALAQAGYDGYVSIEYEVPIDYTVGIPHDVACLRGLLQTIDRPPGAGAPRRAARFLAEE